MKRNELTTEQKQAIHSQLLQSFSAPDGYDVNIYYGVLMMVYKKNGDYHLKLQHDYGKSNPINSPEPLIIDNLEEAIIAYQILAERITGKQTKRFSMMDAIATTQHSGSEQSTGF